MEINRHDLRKAMNILKKENIEARKNSNDEIIPILRKSQLQQLAYDKALELESQEE